MSTPSIGPASPPPAPSSSSGTPKRKAPSSSASESFHQYPLRNRVSSDVPIPNPFQSRIPPIAPIPPSPRSRIPSVAPVQNPLLSQIPSIAPAPNPLCSRVSSVAPVPESSPPVRSTSSVKRKRVDDFDRSDTFYCLLVAKIGREIHKGALGKKWRNTIHWAGMDLQENPSKEFLQAFNAMNGQELAKMLRDHVQNANPFSIKE